MRFNKKEQLFDYIYDLKNVNMIQVLFEKRDYKIFINGVFDNQMCDCKSMCENFLNALDTHYHFIDFNLSICGNEDFKDLYIDIE